MLTFLRRALFGSVPPPAADGGAEACVTLVRALLWADGALGEPELAEAARHLATVLPAGSPLDLNELFRLAPDAAELDAACAVCAQWPYDRRERALRALLGIAVAGGAVDAKEDALLRSLAAKLGLPEAAYASAASAAVAGKARQQMLLESGAGLLAALMIVALFVLTATFLKSVLFGLILAYFCLPLQGWFARRFFPHPVWKGVERGVSLALYPLTTTVRLVRDRLQKGRTVDLDAISEPQERLVELKLAHKSCLAATLVVIGAVSTFLLAASWFSSSYLAGVGKTASDWLKTESQSASPGRAFVDSLAVKADSLKPMLEKVPFLKSAVAAAKEYLSDDENLKALGKLALSKGGGLLSFTADTVGLFSSFLLNLALTFFFFSYFIRKMAAAGLSARTDGRGSSDYIVDGVFNSGWTPHATTETRDSAKQIIDNIIMKLRAWVRGYLSIIVVEGVIYSVLFMLIGVPYGAALGLVAGLGVLLPYIGPIGSFLLTAVVCLAGCTDAAMLRLILVMVAYLIVNGVVEQLFLYPALVGGALGLNELETVIVVLMGGVVAGFAGMIFAVPAASVLKYLIPRIYNCGRGVLARSPKAMGAGG